MQKLTYPPRILGVQQRNHWLDHKRRLGGLRLLLFRFVRHHPMGRKRLLQGPNPQAVGTLTTGLNHPNRWLLPLLRNSPTCLPLHLFLTYSFLCGSLDMKKMSVNFLYRIHIYCLFSLFSLVGHFVSPSEGIQPIGLCQLHIRLASSPPSPSHMAEICPMFYHGWSFLELNDAYILKPPNYLIRQAFKPQMHFEANRAI